MKVKVTCVSCLLTSSQGKNYHQASFEVLGGGFDNFQFTLRGPVDQMSWVTIGGQYTLTCG